MTAAKTDYKERPKKRKKAEPKNDDEMLDNALDDSFPASDPPAMTTPTVSGVPPGKKRKVN